MEQIHKSSYNKLYYETNKDKILNNFKNWRLNKYKEDPEIFRKPAREHYREVYNEKYKQKKREYYLKKKEQNNILIQV